MVWVAAKGSEEAIREFMRATDRVAEINNRMRVATRVELTGIEVEPQ